MATKTKIFSIPDSALVVLVGTAGSGKSTFAHAHFRATEILSSDTFRAMVSDDEGDQEATADAFELLHLVLDKRLRRGKMCVVDATNIRAEHRARFIEQARLFKRRAAAIVLDTPEPLAIERAGSRAGRTVNAAVIRRQFAGLKLESQNLLSEGFAEVFRLSPLDKVEIRRIKALPARR